MKTTRSTCLQRVLRVSITVMLTVCKTRLSGARHIPFSFIRFFR